MKKKYKYDTDTQIIKSNRGGCKWNWKKLECYISLSIVFMR